MLIASDIRKRFRHRGGLHQNELWHEAGYTPSLGCVGCANRHTCGGLRIKGAFYDCLDNCCREPATCDAVCRMKPMEFAQRVREIGGFLFDNVPRASQLRYAPLPLVVPILYHGKRRETAFVAPSVCLSLYNVIPRHDGSERFSSAKEVAKAFQFRPGTPVILTGTDKDAPLERWWNIGTARLEVISRLRDLGVVLVTTPNYSLFTDRPRWDDMHSMKRIAISHEEFLRMGIPQHSMLTRERSEIGNAGLNTSWSVAK